MSDDIPNNVPVKSGKTGTISKFDSFNSLEDSSIRNESLSKLLDRLNSIEFEKLVSKISIY